MKRPLRATEDRRRKTDATPPDLPDDWKSARLGELNTAVPKSINPMAFPDETFEYYSIPAFQEFGAPVLARGNEILSNKILVENGTVMFGKLNPRVLKVWLVNSASPHRKIASTEFLPILPSDEAAAEFIYYFCQASNLVAQANQLVSGSTPSRERVDKKSFYEILVPLPPLPQQRAIAYALRTVQQARAARQRELTLERERKAALMEYLFTHGTRGEPRKQTEIGEMPESRRVAKLRNLANLITKGASPKWQGYDYREEGVTFVRSQNIGWGRLELDELVYLPEAFNRKENKSIMKSNDLLINLVGASIGRAAVATEEIEGGNLNQAIAIVRLNEDYSSHFGMYFILTESGQVQLHKFEKDIARANVSLDDINNYLVPFPNMEEQQSIVRILRACDAKIAALEREAQVLDELFRAMLDELMTGKLSAVPLMRD